MTFSNIHRGFIFPLLLRDFFLIALTLVSPLHNIFVTFSLYLQLYVVVSVSVGRSRPICSGGLLHFSLAPFSFFQGLLSCLPNFPKGSPPPPPPFFAGGITRFLSRTLFPEVARPPLLPFPNFVRNGVFSRDGSPFSPPIPAEWLARRTASGDALARF